jgi:4-amino-4-deoxy-L-arabinose transferase-like glycosyltransferase
MNRATAVPATVLTLLVAFLLSGVGQVPFHPDETSLLFESRDLELYVTDPRSMAWSEAGRGQAEQEYRALNAPLSKYVLGIGRRLAGHGPDEVGVDWDWSLSWEDNRLRGALPAADVLIPARLASTSLVAAALVLMYLCGVKFGGRSTGLVSAVLLGLNALVLLHGRRAMAEGTLIFAVCLGIWGILHADRRPWLAGLAAALAFSAKHTALPLLPLGWLAVLWREHPASPAPFARQAARSSAIYVGTAALVVMAMNPLLWSDPLASGMEVLRARQALVREQIQAQAEHSALPLPMTGVDSTSALIAQLFLTPLQFEELPNYAENLSQSIAGYLQNPLHSLLRGWISGALLMALTLAGMVLGLARLRTAGGPVLRDFGLLLLTTLVQAVVMVLTLPFPYQRYYLPLVPLCVLWAAFALSQLATLMKRLPIRKAA